MESDVLIPRRQTKKIFVGNVAIGGDAPITVQSMTNTDTCDVKATCKQIDDLCEAGADIVRVSCPDMNSVISLKEIVRNSRVPIVADIHYNYKLAIEAAKLGVGAIRINPGNIGRVSRVSEVVRAAKDNNCSIRIGVNAGSLERTLLEKYKEPCPEAMLESAIDNMRYLEDLDFFEFKISVKASDYFLAVKSYELLSEHCDYPLHLGVTEAGTLRNGTVLSAMGIGHLLSQGIGDTLRVSLSADPVEEIKVGYSILKSLNLRHRGVKIISCPSCARQGFDVISIVQRLEEALEHIKVPLTLSVLGCVVNGPGEAKHVDVGLVGGGKQQNALYLDGSVVEKIQNKDIIKRIVSEIEEKAYHFEVSNKFN